MHQISNYDKRQLDLMMQQLNSFENGEIDLFSLQSSLEFLFQAMEYVNDFWENSFLEEISTLASINADSPNDKQINVKVIIAETLKNLKNLVKQVASP